MRASDALVTEYSGSLSTRPLRLPHAPMNAPALPSVLPSSPAIQDSESAAHSRSSRRADTSPASTTPEQLETAGVGRVTSPTECVGAFI